MRTGNPRGEALPLAKVWELSQVWYRDRLSPAYRGRSNEEAMALLASVELTGPYWRVD